jgi:SAM-dependent methyltransferase
MKVEFLKDRADRYFSAMTLAPEARRSEIKNLVEALHRHGVGACRRILDLGAGHGYATTALLDFLGPEGEILAVDISADMLARIPKRCNIRTMVASLDRLEVEDGSVDLAISLASFHHVPHKGIVMREVRRALRPGGHFLIADVAEGTPTQRFFDNVVRHHCSTGHDFDFLDTPWAGILAERAGMVLLASGVKHTDWRFQSESDMLGFVGNLLGLDLPVSDLAPLLERWLRPRVAADGWTVILPWSLGFHMFRKE